MLTHKQMVAKVKREKASLKRRRAKIDYKLLEYDFVGCEIRILEWVLRDVLKP